MDNKEQHNQDTRLIETFPPWYLENIKNFSYTETVSEHYTCAICLDILDDPLEELNCGNMFCKSCCISLHVCPICRANVDHFYPSPKSMANYLNDLKIKCTLCEMNLLKEGFGKHLYECSNVKILCICGELVARINEPNHILNCSANVDCGGKSLGCQIVLRRNEIKDHEKTCIYVECQELKKENQQLRQQIESLTIQTRGIPGVKKESDNRKYKRGDKGKPGKKIDSDEVNKIDSDEEDSDSSGKKKKRK